MLVYESAFKMEKINNKILLAEIILRILSVVLSALTAVVVGLDEEMKTVMFSRRRAYIKMLPALWIMTITVSVATCYHFLQLCRCLAIRWFQKNPCKHIKTFAWICLLLDQGMAYAVLGTSLAAAQGSLVAVTGVKELQWQKLCNIYTKFCLQAASGIVVGLLATLAMAVISSISAYNLFYRRSSVALSAQPSMF